MSTQPIDFSSVGGKPVTNGPIDFSSVGGKPVTTEPASQPSLGQVLTQPTAKTDKDYLGYTGPAGVAGATIHGMSDVARGTTGAIKGAWDMLTAPPKDAGETASGLLGPPGLALYRTLTQLGHSASDATNIVGAIHDINQSPDSTERYLQAAQDTASQGAGQALTAIGTEGLGKVSSSVKAGAADAGSFMAEGAITKLIKPMAADLKFGRDPAGAIIREGITGNSLEDLGPKVYAKARAVGQQIDSALQTPDAQAQTINVNDALSPIDERMAQAVKNGDKEVYDRLSGLKQQLTKEWAEDPKTGSIAPSGDRNLQMTPYDATQFKRNVGDMTRWTGNDPFEEDLNAVKGEIFGKLKDQVNTAVPDVADLNSRYANLVSAGKAIERRTPIAARNAAISLGDMVLGGASYHALGPYGLAAVGLKKLALSPAFRTREAQFLSPEADSYPPFEELPKGAQPQEVKNAGTAETNETANPPAPAVQAQPANGRSNPRPAVYEPRQPELPTAPGASTELKVAGEDKSIPAKYEVRELSDLRRFDTKKTADRIETLLNQSLGNKPLQPNVPLRDQGNQ